jgi:DNA-binding HxlR family transcriptional regulator
MAERRYDQNCPIAVGLDILGERWTLLILRELLGGARRYSDLRAQLPAIGTNLLAQRLRELEDYGLVERAELPPPAARIVYRLSELGWRHVPPVLQVVALFGLTRLPAFESGEAITPLSGFLAGILMAFDPVRAAGIDATYEVRVDDRLFEFAVRDGRLAAPSGEPQVRVAASAKDLVDLRLSQHAATKTSVVSRITMVGTERARTRFRILFGFPRATAERT